MVSRILVVFLVSTLAACSGSGGEKPELVSRTAEQRCLELEHRWDVAQQALVQAESRKQSSWLYHVADSFNPLTNNSNKSLDLAAKQEMRARENYNAFGCVNMNKMQTEPMFNTEVFRQDVQAQEPAPLKQVDPRFNPKYQTPVAGQLGYVDPNQPKTQEYAQNYFGGYPAAEVTSFSLGY